MSVNSLFGDVSSSLCKINLWRRTLIRDGKSASNTSRWRILFWYPSTTCRKGVGNHSFAFAFAIRPPCFLIIGINFFLQFLRHDYPLDEGAIARPLCSSTQDGFLVMLVFLHIVAHPLFSFYGELLDFPVSVLQLELSGNRYACTESWNNRQQLRNALQLQANYPPTHAWIYHRISRSATGRLCSLLCNRS